MKHEIAGAIVDADDGTRLEWSFNPETFDESDSANYAKINIPGMSHPRIQFSGGGEHTLAFAIPLHYSNTDVAKDIKTLRSWLYAEYSGGRLQKGPHLLLIQFGEAWQGEKWRMESCDIAYQRFDREGKPIMAAVSVRFTEHVGTSRGMSEIRG